MLLVGSLSTQAQNSTIRGDANLDGKVNISDVTSLIDYLLTDTWGDEPVTPPDENDYEWVDLGLPSGTLWATCNVGANSPEDFGDYFAWGETVPKDVYDKSTYKWCIWSSASNDYTLLSKYSYLTGKKELDQADDAAYINWGPAWRMPSWEQTEELSLCTISWITMNGVKGLLLTGPNGNSIFLPAAGMRDGTIHQYKGLIGQYWSRTVDAASSQDYWGAYFMEVAETSFTANKYYGRGRWYGRPIRAVRAPLN